MSSTIELDVFICISLKNYKLWNTSATSIKVSDKVVNKKHHGRVVLCMVSDDFITVCILCILFVMRCAFLERYIWQRLNVYMVKQFTRDSWLGVIITSHNQHSPYHFDIYNTFSRSYCRILRYVRDGHHCWGFLFCVSDERWSSFICSCWMCGHNSTMATKYRRPYVILMKVDRDLFFSFGINGGITRGLGQKIVDRW